MSVLALIAAFFAPQIVRYFLASGFADDPAREQLTIYLLRIMLPSAVLFGVSGLLMGILNAHQSFHPCPRSVHVLIGIILGYCFCTKPGVMVSPGAFFWVPVSIC
jgi:putative peptidoglycan lipid II flippase